MRNRVFTVRLKPHSGPGKSYSAAVYPGQKLKLKILVEPIFLVSKQFFGVPSFFKYAIADGLYNLLFPDKTRLKTKRGNAQDFQLCFSFW